MVAGFYENGAPSRGWFLLSLLTRTMRSTGVPGVQIFLKSICCMGDGGPHQHSLKVVLSMLDMNIAHLAPLLSKLVVKCLL